MLLPECFCWSRFGTEAGQGIEEILSRKEEERVANNGVFFWGIGNALGPSITELLRRTKEPEVLFSPIKSAPRAKDGAPPRVAAWTEAETLDGDPFVLPEHTLVTSRYDPLSRKKTHYALVCFSRAPLVLSTSEERIGTGSLLNLLTARPVGASQVTAVVQRKLTNLYEHPTYDISMRVQLVYPYFLRLKNPVVLSKSGHVRDWSKLVSQVWDRKRSDKSLGRVVN